jgi:N-acetyl-gamma-glutamyl-phosphate reductase
MAHDRTHGASLGVGVLGATGYAGAELVGLLLAHPRVHLRAGTSRGQAGKTLLQALPHLAGGDLVLEDDNVDPVGWRARGIEVVFACLPHGAFAARAKAFLDAGLQVVDVSADFRLRTAADYPRFYKREHPAPALLHEAVYGLSEWARPLLVGARLVANPGCYATAMLLATLPAAVRDWIDPSGPILVNAVSGVSGAGRVPQTATHFVECGNSVSPYKVGEAHQHLGEVGQTLRERGSAATVVFNPHLVPMARGILATVAVPLVTPIAGAAAQAAFCESYADAPCVRVLGPDILPETRFVRASNRCDLAVRVVNGGRTLLVFSALDNLVKGAAGQAVQNLNLMRGWPETCGLPLTGVAAA